MLFDAYYAQQNVKFKVNHGYSHLNRRFTVSDEKFNKKIASNLMLI